MGVNVERRFAEEASDLLSNLDEVLEIHEMHGTFDLLLKMNYKIIIEEQTRYEKLPLKWISTGFAQKPLKLVVGQFENLRYHNHRKRISRKGAGGAKKAGKIKKHSIS